MPRSLLPRERAGYTIDELLRLLQQADLLLGEPAKLALRSVAFESSNERWIHFGTVLRVLPATAPDPPADVIRLDKALLVATSHEAPVADLDDLRRLLTTWRFAAATATGFDLWEFPQVEHFRSRNRWTEEPCWTVDLREKDAESDTVHPPSGPFLDLSSGFFAGNGYDLVARWLQDPFLRNPSAARYDYRVIIPDHRARLAEFNVKEDRLEVTVVGRLADQLHCGMVIQNARGDVDTQLAPIAGGLASLPLPGQYRQLDIWLLNQDGDWVDHYFEHEYSRAWESAPIRQSPDLSAPSSLQAALETGESTHYEFKKWVILNRNEPKAEELLRTASAFANTAGGEIFIGVDDHLEPVGIESDLRKSYNARVKGDDAALEAAYSRDLQKLFADGLDPLPEFEIEWLTWSHHRILRIGIPKGGSGPYFLANKGEVYVRTGGNSRKLRHSDIPELKRF
jgi:hypothetical protein